jgi:translation elongation factor EF-G
LRRVSRKLAIRESISSPPAKLFCILLRWSDNFCLHAGYYRGSLIGHPVENIRITLTDGASHAVDSSELAFKLAAIYAFRQVSISTFLGVQMSFLVIDRLVELECK